MTPWWFRNLLKISDVIALCAGRASFFWTNTRIYRRITLAKKSHGLHGFMSLIIIGVFSEGWSESKFFSWFSKILRF